MKIFALGGYGKTGFPAIKLLAQSDFVTKIAVAGRNLEHAENASSKIGEKAIAIYTDGTDDQELRSLIKGYDIIMNTASNEVVLPSIRAAIHNGIPYCDISWGEILDQALQLASEAKATGITAIVANGISPCISNLMGVHVASKLEEINQLQIGRAELFNFENGRELTPDQWLKDPTESLTTLNEFKPHLEWMYQRLQEDGARTIIDYYNGRWMEVDPISKGLEIPLPQGGTITSYPFGAVMISLGCCPVILRWCHRLRYGSVHSHHSFTLFYESRRCVY